MAGACSETARTRHNVSVPQDILKSNDDWMELHAKPTCFIGVELLHSGHAQGLPQLCAVDLPDG